ncbi:hypothetical protein E2C01_029066 [Portunus trituberculatus]|uniref:Uncharacterized protein n=1 Tax=Portunus trituberculatus TaxID=210409 RepID=A0A5B7EM50_PORTR|nr:hypothetical protein [Portunus trituberculatus]
MMIVDTAIAEDTLGGAGRESEGKGGEEGREDGRVFSVFRRVLTLYPQGLVAGNALILLLVEEKQMDEANLQRPFKIKSSFFVEIACVCARDLSVR